MMTAFTVVTGIVTLIGFFFQIRGLYPEYRRFYASATFFLFGLTVGVASAAIAGTSINLPDTVTAKNILGFVLFLGTGLLIFVCFAATVIVADQDRRSELSKIGSAASGFLIFLLAFFPSTFFPENSASHLTYDERIECALRTLERENFERALVFIADAKKQLPIGDSRHSGLDKLASDVRSRQASLLTKESLKAPHADQPGDKTVRSN